MSGVPTLLASIVLFQPETGQLAQTLATLDAAIAEARRAGVLGEARILLTDHSPTPTKVSPVGTAIDYDFVGANPGFGAGHNRAFRRGGESADFFLVANPDLEFFTDSLSCALTHLATQPQCGLLAPRLIEDNGGERPAAFRRPRWRHLVRRFLGRPGDEEALYECRDLTTSSFAPEIVSGCCMLWRSAAFARLGGFDEAYFLYFEDFDLSLRAARLGLTGYCPEMRVRHHGGGAGRKGWRHVAYMLRSAWRFQRQHGLRW